MGICRSTCAQSRGLDDYDGWQPTNAPANGRLRTTMRDRSFMRKTSRTKLWTCESGCCSIRWKLDYAEFQSYSKYAEISPYIVVQEDTGACACVICRGLPDQLMQCRVEPQAFKHLRQITPNTTPSETDEDEDDTLLLHPEPNVLEAASKPSTVVA
ncbi:hypothetical protein Poli38472_003949 [Pythium oligandrum]|uniref:Uncharacterized protein n=1 Tax=Pythium oligandrum TaxID=41045 RepID=A0A8K1CN70_PYTOL|nr:hypothetical protein Poli38472_003949 [Pythium oligandrum]|eukprot:TMW66184.1 hypothetical protein Poli38472_003949 [Pythium oligandrum]